MSAHLHDHPFKFYRVRGGSEVRIYPHAGARLHFGSREADSLSLPTLPVGTLAAGDQVKVTYLETTVFLGTVEKRVLRKTGGSEQTENVTVLGPWSKMARLVYRQGWLSMGAAARSSRLILNQTQGGAPQNLNSELAEIAQHAAQACGYAVGTISVSTQVLPSDECRDITVADAIRRELRLFPKAVARFDYSSGTPTLVIEKPSTSSTSSTYSTVSKSEREIEYDEHPITGVDLQIDESGEIDGVGYLNITHQTAGDTAADNPDCLYATLQIKGASSNTVRQSFKSITEDPNSGGQWKTKGWWKQKHPRLANVALDAITINPADCLCDGANALPEDCPRISAATAGELEEAGLMCRVCKFTAKATIETDDDKEEALYLTMHFLMTNATGTAEHPKTYTWVAESSSESGESVPAGLAAAILAERCGRIRSEKMTVRLGETFPAIGNTITDEGETLPLQSIDVDCADLTADLVFGAPEYLSPEDMAALLSNFRNKRTTSSSSLRKTGKTEDQGSNVEMGGIPPLSSTEFQPGTKAKTTIKSTSPASSNGSVVLDSSALESGETAGLNKLILKDESGKEKEIKILSTGNIKIHKTIVSTVSEAIDGDPAGASIRFNYSDGSCDTIVIYNGAKGRDGTDGRDGDTPEITAEKNGIYTNIFADGVLIATIQDGTAPVITAEKQGTVTTIYVNGNPVATINDGTASHDDELVQKTCIYGIKFRQDQGKIQAVLSTMDFWVPNWAGKVPIEHKDALAVDIADVSELDVVTSEAYSASTHQFTNLRKRVKVIGKPQATPGQTPFTATPLSEEG